ncbi:MAG: hypothetical protein O7C75_04835, partial [Verrucomicrobia bacterium]|nr:hypothetical protein [Verrucomicrobiota bacterium]
MHLSTGKGGRGFVITDAKWKDQATACRIVLDLVQQSDWDAVDALTEKAYSTYPDSLALAGTRMNALYQLDRAEEAVEIGVEFVGRFPDSDKIIRNIQTMLPKLPMVNKAWLSILARLTSEAGQVLYVRALVLARRGIDAEAAYSELNTNFPEQKTFSRLAFATLLLEEDLFEIAEKVLLIIAGNDFPGSSLVRTWVDVLLRLASKNQPERFGEARQLAEALLAREPDSTNSWYAMGRVWTDASRIDRSLPFLRRFLEQFPKHSMRPGVTFTNIYDETATPQFLFDLHTSLGKTISEGLPKDLPEPEVDFDWGRTLRVGFVSPDFGLHPVGYFGINTIPVLDADQIEVFLYSQRDPATQNDALSQEFRNAVADNHWRWIHRLSDRQLFDRVREDKIDILVDLAGYTTGNRIQIFGMRAAPVQVSWLGYPHSTGMPNMDYRISDEIVDPEGVSEQLSTETIVRLPNGVHAIRMPDGLPEPSPPPCLKNGYLTFGSFNNVNKMGHHTIEMWAALLAEIPDARLLLKHRTMNVFENREGIRSLFAFFGVDPNRLKFLGTTTGRAAHFGMYEQMDIALDPLGYNGTTTTCEALYMGVPVLTLPGCK